MKKCPRAAQPLLNGRVADTEEPADAADAHPFQIVEHNGFAVPAREPSERLEDACLPYLSLVLLVWGGLLAGSRCIHHFVG